jgi:hypothetical protein
VCRLVGVSMYEVFEEMLRLPLQNAQV